MNVDEQYVGNFERIIRVVAGLAIIAWAFYAKNWWGLIGIIPLLTGLVGWCPPYALLGINTCSLKDKNT